MLTLSKKTDYALLALSHLMHAGEDRPVNTKEIAEKFAIPVELLAKILQSLARAKIVVSTPGPTGGYRLARAPEYISVAEVLTSVDGPPAIAQCFRVEHNGCEQLNHCTIRGPLERVSSRVFQMLNHVSLAEINRDEEPSGIIPIQSVSEFRTAPGAMATSLK
jgi:Rrf2 family protein